MQNGDDFLCKNKLKMLNEIFLYKVLFSKKLILNTYMYLINNENKFNRSYYTIISVYIYKQL